MNANNTNTAQANANKAKHKGAPTLNAKQGANSSAAFQKKVISAEQNYLQNKARFIMLKCLVELDYFNLFIRKISSDYDSIAEFLGFSSICDSLSSYRDDKRAYKSKILSLCADKFYALQTLQKQGKFGSHKVLHSNLCLLKETLGLNHIEFALLELIAIVEEVSALKEFFKIFDNSGRRKNILIISQMLDYPCKEIATALHKDSILKKMGIIETKLCSDLYFMLSFENIDFIDILLSEYSSKEALTRNFATPCGQSELSKSDYAYIKEFDLVQNYLKKALAQKKIGVNILLYGKPGTGKTEFAKLIAQSVGAKLHKVKSNDDDGEATDGEERLNSYLLAQHFLEPSQNILLYDEVEDILSSSKHEKRLHNKAFLNENLENNKVATIWITNDIYSIDNAIIRRFDFVLEAKVPKKETREQILAKICGDKLDEKAFDFAKNAKNLAPAIIKKAYDISCMVNGDFSANFITLIKNTLKAQGSKHKFGKKKKSKADKTELPQSYSAEFINTNADVESIAEGIKTNANARICLYGLSGTGKSAYARYIAKKLNRPCLVKSASDLKSCWLGESEKNIAKAFKEAKNKGAVLVFDEVDSFLQDRNNATRSWEISEVNEMLVQMEKFEGVFIATTNLMDGLDKACLRRFDLKLEFKALSESQRVKLFEKECKLLGIACQKSIQTQVARLDYLVAGDFAAVKRQIKFKPLQGAKDFYERLCEEVKVKDLKGENAKAGFFA